MITIALFIATTIVVNSDSFVTTIREAKSPSQINAEGCVVTPFACNSQATGRLTSTDCTSNGAPLDVYEFDGTAGNVVTATIRTAAFNEPLAAIVPPLGDASKTPIIFGGRLGATVTFVMGSTGRWRIGVGSSDIFATGDYIVAVSCSPDTEPSLPQNCIPQMMLCGQTATWELTGQSCRFSNSDTTYQEFQIYGVAGDVLTTTLLTNDFDPLFGIYDLDTNNLLASGTRNLSFTFPKTAMYSVLATSEQPRSTGFFGLQLTCSVSGCLEPLVTLQPADVSVPTGQRATLTTAANGTDVHIDWYDVREVPGTFVGSGNSFTTPPITSTQYYQATARNSCGAMQSRIVTVTRTNFRRRAVRR